MPGKCSSLAGQGRAGHAARGRVKPPSSPGLPQTSSYSTTTFSTGSSPRAEGKWIMSRTSGFHPLPTPSPPSWSGRTLSPTAGPKPPQGSRANTCPQLSSLPRPSDPSGWSHGAPGAQISVDEHCCALASDSKHPSCPQAPPPLGCPGQTSTLQTPIWTQRRTCQRRARAQGRQEQDLGPFPPKPHAAPFHAVRQA